MDTETVSKMDKMGLKWMEWMEWMGIWGGIRQRRGWNEGKVFGEDLEYVGRYGITTVKGGRFAKSGKSWIVWGGNGFLDCTTTKVAPNGATFLISNCSELNYKMIPLTRDTGLRDTGQTVSRLIVPSLASLIL